MVAHPFEPFQDRLSRDIRNELSEAFSRCLAQDDLAAVQAVAKHYRAAHPAIHYLHYIDDRLTRYAQALQTIRNQAASSAWAQGIILWDLGLFFEVHEVLELAWHKARGSEREILQAMIRAAGFYIKSEYGYHEAAAKMATKAASALSRHRAELPPDFPVERLLDSLTRLGSTPPRLGREATVTG